MGTDTDELDGVLHLLVPDQEKVGTEVGFDVVAVLALEPVGEVRVVGQRARLFEDAESGFHLLAVGFGEGLEVLLELCRCFQRVHGVSF